MWLRFLDTKEKTLNWIFMKNVALYEEQRLTECCLTG